MTKPKLISLTPRGYYRESNALLLAALVGIVCCIGTVNYLRREPIPQPKVAQVHQFRPDACLICHVERTPTIKNYYDYKKVHPSPAEKRKIDHEKLVLKDLKEANQ